MPIKKGSIVYSLRKDFLWKSFEHYLRNRKRTVFKGVPDSVHGKFRVHKISHYKGLRFYEIFCGILISRNRIFFGKYCGRIS